MANCVLCGKEIGRFEQVKIEFHGTQQVLCDDCHIRFVRASGRERMDMEQKIMESMDPVQRALAQTEIDTGHHCPNCGALLELKFENMLLGTNSYYYCNADLYLCPQCGRMEWYAPGTRRAPFWCERCGKGSFTPNCPDCREACIPMEEHLKAIREKEAAQAAEEEKVPPQNRGSEGEASGFHLPWQKREKPPWEG